MSKDKANSTRAPLSQDELLATLDFGNEAGDDVDAAELLSYFVEQQSFRHFLDREKRLLVATARKGVGKSALLNGRPIG